MAPMKKGRTELEVILNQLTGPLPHIPAPPKARPADPEALDVSNPFVSPFAAIDEGRAGAAKPKSEAQTASPALEKDRRSCWSQRGRRSDDEIRNKFGDKK